MALERHGPAITGQAGGLHTVQAGMILTRDHALTDEEAWPLLEEWNETCVPPWEPDELRAKALGNGKKYARGEYGSRRTLDVVERARKLIHDWRADVEESPATEPERERSMDMMIQACRELVRTSTEPAHRERIQNELIAATGLGALALALPRVRAALEKRAEPSAEQTTWTVYGFELSPSGAPVPNMDNVVRALEHEKHSVFFEVFSQRLRGPRGEWSDADDLALALHLQRDLGLSKVTPQIVNHGVQTYARSRARDVVREHLERLTWDGTPRIAGFLAAVYGAPDTDYTRAASANFWKSMAARVLQPGCKVDHMLVLEGSQGIRKSTSARAIAGEHLFAEASESPTSKDFFLALQGKLIVEVAEMDSFSRAEVAAVKRVLTCRSDRFRAPYERTSRDWPRRGVFVGTTNRDDWARDDTGGRRFWPIRCTRVDIDYINANRDQLFAEAVSKVNAGESWWEMPAEATQAEQEARRQVDPWEELIGAYLSGPEAPGKVTTANVLRLAVNLDTSRMDRAAEMRAASVLKRLGFVRVDGWHDGRKAKYWRREEVGSA
ncbi:virulence-associated E family protein [Archangium lansingense]|uniref:Virulence-associated E family protein n=1 Tax=Archangium lansingense TaxID=2995310 RepID=A0ABT4A8Z4_9BACT|nr:virulence-associated E family protein [Archangium lansinium]MCY1077407.1 virulence-associated E family protein [Archangium lansinium]